MPSFCFSFFLETLGSCAGAAATGAVLMVWVGDSLLKRVKRRCFLFEAWPANGSAGAKEGTGARGSSFSGRELAHRRI